MEESGEKLEQWTRFHERAQTLLRGGPRALRKLSAAELTRLIDDYQALTADLARARSLGAARETVDQLNRIAVTGHNLLYGQIRLRERRGPSHGLGAFARLVRRHGWAVALSAAIFFGAALASTGAAMWLGGIRKNAFSTTPQFVVLIASRAGDAVRGALSTTRAALAADVTLKPARSSGGPGRRARAPG